MFLINYYRTFIEPGNGSISKQIKNGLDISVHLNTELSLRGNSLGSTGCSLAIIMLIIIIIRMVSLIAEESHE